MKRLIVNILIFFGTIIVGILIARMVTNNDDQKVKEEAPTWENPSGQKPLPPELKLVKDMNEIAQDKGAGVVFAVDGKDNSILIINRREDINPEDIEDWNAYLLSAETSIEILKQTGFKKVKIYTSLSNGATDFTLKSLD